MRYTRMVVTGRRTFKAGGKSYSMILHFLTLTAGFDVSIRQPSFTGSSQVTVSQLWEINDHASPTPTNALIFFVTIFSIFKALVKNTLLICFPLIGWSVIGISGSNLMVFVVRTIRQSPSHGTKCACTTIGWQESHGNAAANRVGRALCVNWKLVSIANKGEGKRCSHGKC